MEGGEMRDKLAEQISKILAESTGGEAINEICHLIHQLRQETAREIFNKIKQLWKPQHHNLCYGVIKPHPDCVCCKLQSLKGDYLEESK